MENKLDGKPPSLPTHKGNSHIIGGGGNPTRDVFGFLLGQVEREPSTGMVKKISLGYYSQHHFVYH